VAPRARRLSRTTRFSINAKVLDSHLNDCCLREGENERFCPPTFAFGLLIAGLSTLVFTGAASAQVGVIRYESTGARF
jgi:hypothetical protein